MAALDTYRIDATDQHRLTVMQRLALRAAVWALFDLVADQQVAFTIWRVPVRLRARHLEPLIVALVGERMHLSDPTTAAYLPALSDPSRPSEFR